MSRKMSEALQSPDVTAFCALLSGVLSQSELKLLCQKFRAQHAATQQVLHPGQTNHDSLLCVQQIVDGYRSWTGESLY